ncbi:MAG: hypothetical protein Q8M98_05865 [Candidatus Cloacimonadaceae bacterium]|nr:hypothetical protein [Candidatus Cloacimonadaceae bacterium]MDP3114289.1 hypothetical protein [Candidatus Cloacimonadaceae bacterium]
MRQIAFVTILMLSLAIGAAAISIYEIQYSVSPGVDNSYPSQYVGQEVSLEGIVTATNYRGGGFFISESISGPWRGILVLDRRNNPGIGDKVLLRGRVSESFGMTCIQDISSFRIIDRNLPLPQPVIVTTGQLSRSDEAEVYEGVLVRVLSSSSSSSRVKQGKFKITDGSGQCSVIMGGFSDQRSHSPAVGTQYSSLTGIVIFGYSEFALHPISQMDVQVQSPVSTQNRSWGRIKSIYK